MFKATEFNTGKQQDRVLLQNKEKKSYEKINKIVIEKKPIVYTLNRLFRFNIINYFRFHTKS